MPIESTNLPAALRAIRRGRRVPSRHLAWLKARGYIGGALDAPVLTAKGALLAEADIVALDKTDASAGTAHASDQIHLPDAMERLAKPRKGEAALIEPCDLAAARKFQSDLQHAGLRQRITQSWSLAAMSQGGAPARAGSAHHEPTAMLDARDRVNRACASIGPEFSGLLIDICLFEKTLTGVERERHWPARSAKLAIALGLRSLARHYGLTEAAHGVAR